jgi:transglutaminase-like putative cysteine protease
MSTTVVFQDQISLTVPAEIKTLTVSIPMPVDRSLYGYEQVLSGVTVSSSRDASSISNTTDAFGNKYQIDVFRRPEPGTIIFTIKAQAAHISVDLNKPYPDNSALLGDMPSDVSQFLTATDEVQSNDPGIVSLAHDLREGATDEATVTDRIQEWLQKTVSYSLVNPDDSDDAVNVMQHKTSSCDGWAHLFLALARADGLPARFVGGYNFGGEIAYPVDSRGRSTLTVSSAGEPHSWVEVWFPSVGWMPFEPQASAGFVDSHHLAVWVGQDSDSVQNLVSWTTSAESSTNIPIIEVEVPTKLDDQIDVAYSNSSQGCANVITLARSRPAAPDDPKF